MFFKVFLLIVFLQTKFDKVLTCKNYMIDELGCAEKNSTTIPDANCGPGNHDCVVCQFVFDKHCIMNTRCSCFYCCEEKYAKNCPDGCYNCVTDGEGGCQT
ncbi:hypothetical protein niasHT_036181 [Heterodera trifolii]|uniref:Uncharacterized protein n=1 Tax=Heterodera trifolii TaxID=157864 RepID=A0ABD2J0K2_9BILA